MGKEPLKGGAERLLGSHAGRPGKVFRRAYDAVEAEYGPFTALGRLEASRVAAAWVNFDAATRALEAARTTRTTGTGRRPSPRDIERLARRQGLADSSYSQALDKLRELVARRKPLTLAEQLSQEGDA